MNNYNWRLVFLVGVLLSSGNVYAARISNVKATKHNLSATATVSTVKADPAAAGGGEKQICVFCHTPHGASTALKAPLWNHELSNPVGGYTQYKSESIDAYLDSSLTLYGTPGQFGAPGAGSKLCLSCHDGTLAIGSVNVANGLGAQTIAMTGVSTPSGVMPASSSNPDSGETTGFTARLGVDLTNDHPISVYYNAELVGRDGELRLVNTSQQVTSGGTTIVAPRDGTKPLLPLALKIEYFLEDEEELVIKMEVRVQEGEMVEELFFYMQIVYPVLEQY